MSVDELEQHPGAAPPDHAGIDVGELYYAQAGRLERIVRLDVRAPDAVIEDACQFAWSRLVCHAGRVAPESALAWLARTAVHEAFKLIRREDRECSLDATVERVGDEGLGIGARSPDELVEHRAQLELVGVLPERQQRLLWLHALGLSYAEIALQERCTRRTVERQLLRAKRTVRRLADE